MTSQTKSSAPEKIADAQRGLAEEALSRVPELRAEAEATTDRTHKAALLYEAAFLSETSLNQPAQAVSEYLAAYNLDNRFRLPLHALIRLFERKRSLKNLARLYDTQLRSAHTPEEKTTALIDQALLPILGAGEPEAVRARLERALEYDEGIEAALLLEWTRRSAGDAGAAFEALARRAQGCDDPGQRAVLLLEVADELEKRGELSLSLEALRKAAFGSASGGTEGEPNDLALAALSQFARNKGFVPELVEACEKRAELAAARAANDPELDEAVREKLRARALAHWYEAARLRCTSLGDPEGALQSISRALESRPDDVLLRQTRMLAFDLLEDREKAAEEARGLLAMGVDGEHAAALHFRLAEHALVAGQLASARESLMEAIAHAGGSIAADAILDDLLLDEGMHRERVERREERSATASPARANRFLLEAALIVSNEERDAQRALALFRRADAKVEGQPEVLREAYGAGLDLGDQELARFGLEKLLASQLDADERAALLHHLVELTAQGEESRALLAEHLENEEARAFFPQLARLRAAEERDLTLLARAHEKLADQRIEAERSAAHLCSAARAHLKAHNLPAARALLDRVLSNAPSHRYALALQQEVLKLSGATEEIVGLLRRAAEAQTSERDAEISLLLAGAAAEAANDDARAVQNYEQAADRSPQSSGPVWALLRLGQRKHDQAIVLKAREALAEREKAKGQAGIESLLLAEHYELANPKTELAEGCLDGALGDALAGHHAALALLTSPAASGELREQAVELLSQRADEQMKPRLLAELGGTLLAQGAEHARVLDVVERMREAAPDDRWSLWTRASIPLPHDEDGHIAALETLAGSTNDASLADSLLAEACFVRSASAPEAALSGSMLGGFEASAELSFGVAEMIVEMSSPIHDAPLRARALHKLRERAQDRASDLALARALLAAEEPSEALKLLEALLAQNPGDVQALELGRVAARNANNFLRVAELCEALSSQLEGELSLQLLEEAAAVRMDELADLRGSEELLLRILGQSPARKLAFTRLHDLWSARGENARLIELLRERSELVDEADELIGLFYELARMYRAAGDLEAALDAIDNVRMLDEHVGALALAVEIHTARESWAEAVEVLDALATAEFVPDAQRRLARLGAADFLERKLNDGAGALAQLDLIVESGQRDAPLFVRIADVAERVGDVPRTISALQSAIEASTGMEQAELRLRCGRILADRADAPEQARAMFEGVFNAHPNYLPALSALYAATRDENQRQEILRRFEQEVRRELRERPASPEPLRKLLALGELRADAGLSYIALSTLRALGVENLAEREAADRIFPKACAAPRTSSPLSASELNGLSPSETSAAYSGLLRVVLASASEIDQLEPGRFGAGRSHRLSPRDVNALRDEVTTMANALGLRLGDFYVGGDDARRIVAMPRDEEVMFLVGEDVATPLSPAERAQVALQLAATHLQTLPLLSRTPAQGARLIFAAMAACDCPLPGTILKGELGDLPRSVGRALPRKTRRALPDLARTLPDQGAAVEHHIKVALQHTRRLALLLSGHLEPALENVLGALPSPEAIAGSAEALDLIATWTSSNMDALRNRLGFAR